jgi:hypothetical protein
MSARLKPASPYDNCYVGLPTPRHCAAVLGRVQVLRSAPSLRAPSATWTRPARGSRSALVVGGSKISKNDKSGTSQRDLSSGAMTIGALRSVPRVAQQIAITPTLEH